MDKLSLAANEIVRSVQERLGDGYKARLQKVLKNNNLMRTGIVIEKEGTNLSPTIYIDEKVDKYLLNLCPLETIAKEIIKEYLYCDQSEDYGVSSFGNFDWVKDKLVCHLVNTLLNSNLLKEIPSIPFLDLSIVFRVILDPMPVDSTPSILVTNKHLKLWGIDKETIYEIAKENTPKLLPAKMAKLSELIRHTLQEKDIPDVNMYVLTNQRFWFGSYCINYPGILSALAEKENANLYILPSSIYETIITPDLYGIIPQKLKDIVYQVNKTSLPEEELLSCSIYYFSRETQKITQL